MIRESTPEEKEEFVEEECKFPGCKMRKNCVATGCVCPAMVRVRNKAPMTVEKEL